jgi:hypothetical protein
VEELTMIGVRGFAVGVAFGVVATWMVVGLLSVASAAEQGSAPTGVPNGDPCAGQELSFKVDGQKVKGAKNEAPIVPYGAATITGVLHCGTVPIREAQIVVGSIGCLPTGVAPITSSITTGLDGSFTFMVPPGPDRVLSFSYTSYSDDPGPSVMAQVTLRVRPRMSLQIGPSVVRLNHAIYWTATVLGAPFPPKGITLVTQVKEGSRWQTFGEIVLKQEGTTPRVFKYTFTRTFHPTTYTFRLALPRTGSGAYPFAFGASNMVDVHVIP